MNPENHLSKRAIGTQYEEKAAQYLEQRGYRILEKNVNYRWGEIDLVAIDPFENDLVFVEVRFRSGSSMVSPAESITKTKLMRLKRAIQSFLASPQFTRRDLKLEGLRIDLLAFEDEEISHWKSFA